MSKPLGVAVVIIGLIALIGAGFFGWIITNIGTSYVSGLSSVDAATAAQYGLELSQVQQVIDQMNTVLMVSYLWLLTVVITSLYAIYSGVMEFRKK